ncbi:Cell division protein FtsH [Prochlorococcus sp. MIT 0602]|nr:Cell division protein FtsH [Prochlorococcus sp. MIT 0602]
MNDIRSGDVESMILIPLKREVLVNYINGTSRNIPIFNNDQNIIRLAETTSTPLSVKDIKYEQSVSSLTATFSLGIIFVIFCSLLIKNSLKIANKSLTFISGKSITNDSSSIDTRFEDLAGMPEAIAEVSEIVSFLKQPEKFTDLGARIPKGFLLAGPPGTGKTLLAKAIAGEAGVPFVSTSGSQFVELFVGIGAARVRNLFSQAIQNAPSIIFIDEIDSIGRERGSGFGGGNDEREQTLNQLLTEMDGYSDNSGVIVIAATNRPDCLDSALMRPGRFDRRIDVLLPDRIGREQILSIHARSKPLSKDFSIKEWAIKTPGFTGAELSNLLNEAAIIAARDNKQCISNKDLDKALDRIKLGLQNPSRTSLKFQRVTAYNEIGRALITYLIKGCDTLDKITILKIPNNLGGKTLLTIPDEIYDTGLQTRNYLNKKIIVSLAGRATEELIFGSSEITQISESNYRIATDITRKMVTRYGFSDLGPLVISKGNSQYTLDKALLRSKSIYANKTNKEVDKQVEQIMITSLAIAKRTLKPYLNIIDKLADQLIEKEVLTKSEFEDLISQYGIMTSTYK